MIWEAVADELAAHADAISGLRTFAYPPDAVPDESFVVGMPDQIAYDQTFGRGSDEYTVTAWVLLKKMNDRTAYARLAKYISGGGASSIRNALNSSPANPYSACDTVTVQSAETGWYVWNSVTHMGAQFTIWVTGSGS